jgi:hypothetical protein
MEAVCSSEKRWYPHGTGTQNTNIDTISNTHDKERYLWVTRQEDGLQ